MAENKKGFVLYADLIHTVKQMPKEKAGELFLHILKYVNDEYPETDDLIINLTFEPIKQQLKRDLRKYEERAERSRKNGSKGGRPKKTQQDEKKTQKTQQVILKPKKPDKDTVTDKVTDINISKDITPTAEFFIDKDLNQAFLEWIDYRKEIRKTLKPSTAERQVKFLQRFDSKDAILIIEQSIQNGWTGLFEIKNKQNGTKETRDQKYQQEFNKIINKDQRKSASDYRNE